MLIGEKCLSQLEVFHNIFVLPIARKGGHPLPDKHQNPLNRQLLMTPLSVSFKFTLKAMNTIKFQMYDLLQLYVIENKIKIKKDK